MYFILVNEKQERNNASFVVILGDNRNQLYDVHIFGGTVRWFMEDYPFNSCQPFILIDG